MRYSVDFYTYQLLQHRVEKSCAHQGIGVYRNYIQNENYLL